MHIFSCKLTSLKSVKILLKLDHIFTSKTLLNVDYLKNNFIDKDSKEILKYDISMGVVKTHCFHLSLYISKRIPSIKKRFGQLMCTDKT